MVLNVDASLLGTILEKVKHKKDFCSNLLPSSYYAHDIMQNKKYGNITTSYRHNIFHLTYDVVEPPKLTYQ